MGKTRKVYGGRRSVRRRRRRGGVKPLKPLKTLKTFKVPYPHRQTGTSSALRSQEKIRAKQKQSLKKRHGKRLTNNEAIEKTKEQRTKILKFLIEQGFRNKSEAETERKAQGILQAHARAKGSAALHSYKTKQAQLKKLRLEDFQHRAAQGTNSKKKNVWQTVLDKYK